MNAQDIKHIRIHLGETQVQFCRRFGITERHQVYLEKGKRRPGPTLTMNLKTLYEKTRKYTKSARLRDLCSRLIWWQDVSAVENHYLLKKIMDYGTWNDWRIAEAEYRREDFILALKTAKVGDFSPESWNFWHLKLGLKKRNRVEERVLV